MKPWKKNRLDIPQVRYVQRSHNCLATEEREVCFSSSRKISGTRMRRERTVFGKMAYWVVLHMAKELLLFFFLQIGSRKKNISGGRTKDWIRPYSQESSTRKNKNLTKKYLKHKNKIFMLMPTKARNSDTFWRSNQMRELIFFLVLFHSLTFFSLCMCLSFFFFLSFSLTFSLFFFISPFFYHILISLVFSPSSLHLSNTQTHTNISFPFLSHFCLRGKCTKEPRAMRKAVLSIKRWMFGDLPTTVVPKMSAHLEASKEKVNNQDLIRNEKYCRIRSLCSSFWIEKWKHKFVKNSLCERGVRERKRDGKKG